MKKFWKKIAAGVVGLLGVFAAIFGVLWYRKRNQSAADLLEEQAEEQLEQTKENGKKAADQAWKDSATGWEKDQADVLEQVKNEATGISPDELFDRLRGN